ncbi:DUF2339 domain-containing protein [Caulobacter sp. LARHSG274]
MTWLIIIGLAIWALRQNQRLEKLEAKVRMLSSAPPVVVAREPAPVSAPIHDTPPPRPAPAPEPAQLVTPTYRPAYIPASTPAPAATAPAPAPPPLLTPRPPSPPRPAITWAAASTWLAENGLAWLGGGGLALGGLLLVVLAAQRGVFTPPFRIIAAAVLGLAMIAASEWIRRQNDAPGGRHALAAAAAAGAGAVTLYGAVWAAHALYGLIPLPVAGGLAAAVSLGLLALSLLHGEALALLALFGAFLAPWMTGAGAWSPVALEAYLGLLGVTGAAINALRRWARGGLVTLAGLLAWTLAALGQDRQLDAAILLALALAGPVAAVLWRRRSAETAPAPDLFARLPMIALFAVSVGSLLLWTDPVQAGHLPMLGVGFGALLVLAGAAMTVLRLVPASAFAAPVAATTLDLVGHLAFRQPSTAAVGALGAVFALVAVIAAAGLGAALRSQAKARTTLLAVSAVGAAVIATFARSTFDHGPGSLGSVLAGLSALLLATGTVVIARRVEDVRRDAGLGLWVAAAAELLFLTVHATAPSAFEPAALALSGLALAAIANRLAWRGLAATAVAGGLVALAMMLRPDFVDDAVSGRLSLPLLAVVTAVAAAALLAAARIVGGRLADHRTEAEALSTAALLVVLTGAFLVLHALLARLGGPAANVNALLEAALRTALVLAAGLLLAVRGRPDDGPIARWRLILVTTVGAVHGLLTGGLALNPWWGLGALSGGLPVLNDLILIFLAPALLLAAIAYRRAEARDVWTRGWMAAAAVFALLWAVMTVRHGFHPGAAMHDVPIGRVEGCAYALIGLLTARAFQVGRLDGERTAWLRAAAPAVGWTALAVATLVFGWLAHPWWGPFAAAMASPLQLVLLLALYAAGAATAFTLKRGDDLARAALCIAVGLGLALVALLVRTAFHGLDLGAPPVGRAEACIHALVVLLTARALLTPRLDIPRGAWLRAAAPAAGWIALGLAGLVFGWLASPWWGPFDAPPVSNAHVALILALYAVGAAAALVLRRGGGAFARTALCVAVGVLFALVTLLVRWAFEGTGMRDGLDRGGLETWTFSAVWAAFGLIVLFRASARKDVALRWLGLVVLLLTTGKVLLFDMATLDGVVRAASFLVVGALFIAGALVARRLNARAEPAIDKPAEETLAP